MLLRRFRKPGCGVTMFKKIDRLILLALALLVTVGFSGLTGCGGGGKPPTSYVAPEDTPASEQAVPASQEGSESQLVRVAMQPEVPAEFALDSELLPPPSELLALLPESKEASYSENDLARAASAYEDSLPHNRVTRDGDYATYNSDLDRGKSPLTATVSFSTYRFFLEAYDENQTIGFEWELPPSG